MPSSYQESLPELKRRYHVLIQSISEQLDNFEWEMKMQILIQKKVLTLQSPFVSVKRRQIGRFVVTDLSPVFDPRKAQKMDVNKLFKATQKILLKVSLEYVHEIQIMKEGLDKNKDSFNGDEKETFEQFIAMNQQQQIKMNRECDKILNKLKSLLNMQHFTHQQKKELLGEIRPVKHTLPLAAIHQQQKAAANPQNDEQKDGEPPRLNIIVQGPLT